MSAARPIGPTSAAAIVVANMIGAGIFTTSGFALADLGSRGVVLLAWGLGGVLAMAGALCYGAFARRLPESGGEYTFISAAVHPLAGFLAGWVSLLGGFTAPIAVAGLSLQAYLVGSAEPAVRAEWIGTAAIAVAALAHGVRLKHGLRLQNAAVALKLAVLLAFALLGLALLPELDDAATSPARPLELGAFALSLVWISFAYSGWNAAVYVAGQVREPERNLPRVLYLSTGLVTAVYLVVNTVFLYAAPIDALAGRADIGAVAAQALGGPALRRALTLLIALALFTSISSMVMAGPRVYAKMAEDGLFPKWLGRGDPVPSAAVAFQAALAIAVLWLSDLAQLLGYVGFLLGLSAAATVAALISLRVREGALRVPIPGYPWLPAGFVVATLAIAVGMAAREPLPAGLGLLTVLSGLPLYLWSRSRRAPAAAAALALALAVLGVGSAARSAELESLDAGSALAEVRSMQGVVLVDLYADW